MGSRALGFEFIVRGLPFGLQGWLGSQMEVRPCRKVKIWHMGLGLEFRVLSLGSNKVDLTFAFHRVRKEHSKTDR